MEGKINRNSEYSENQMAGLTGRQHSQSDRHSSHQPYTLQKPRRLKQRFGLDPKTQIGGAALPSGLGGGPMKGIHPKPFGHPFKRSKLNEQMTQKKEELSKMILPRINQRRLDELLDED